MLGICRLDSAHSQTSLTGEPILVSEKQNCANQQEATAIAGGESGQLWLRSFDHVPHVERRGTIPINLFHHPTFNCPDLFRGSPGADVVLADKEDNVLNKPERMI
jgi:hypothetical protein